MYLPLLQCILAGLALAAPRQHVFSSGEYPILQEPNEHRIAIIGGGPSGASASYFFGTANKKLQDLAQHPDFPSHAPHKLRTTVFERSRIGGRAEAVYPLDDPGLERVEIGAGLIYETDKTLVRAIETFKLPWVSDQTRLANLVGVWDGSQFVVENDGSTWSQTKLLWRYGRSPTIVLKLLGDAASAFSQLYNAAFLHKRPPHDGGARPPAPLSGYPWSSVAELAKTVLPRGLLSHSAYEYYTNEGVSPLFVNEMATAATRANYAHDVSNVNAFAGLYAFEAGESRHVQNGNHLLFEKMVNQSGADVRVGIRGTVTGIMKMQGNKWWVGTADGHGGTFDSVLVATPWISSGLALLNTHKFVHLSKYKEVHVTLVATCAPRPRAAFFNQSRKDSSMPRTILTAPGAAASNTSHVPFISLSYMRDIIPQQHQTEWGTLYIVRILSYSTLDHELLSELFGNGTVAWVNRRVWGALSDITHEAPLRSFEVDTGLYHTSVIESLLPTMEAAVISAKNVVALILTNWLGDVFVNGINCRWSEHSGRADWSGWGCNCS